MRDALGEVVATKGLLPSNISFTTICASTRWGRTGVHPESGLASPNSPTAMPHSNKGRADAQGTPLTGGIQQVRSLLLDVYRTGALMRRLPQTFLGDSHSVAAFARLDHYNAQHRAWLIATGLPAPPCSCCLCRSSTLLRPRMPHLRRQHHGCRSRPQVLQQSVIGTRMNPTLPCS